MTTFGAGQEAGDRFDSATWLEIETRMDAAGMPWYEAVAATTGNWPQLPGGYEVAPSTNEEVESREYDYLGDDPDASAADRVARRPYVHQSPEMLARQRAIDARGRALAEAALFPSWAASLERRADDLEVPVGALARADQERSRRRRLRAE